MSPLIDGDAVILVPGGGNAVAAVNRKTGQVVWKGGGNDKPGYSTPVPATLAGRKQYVVFLGTSLRGVDAGSGQELWSLPWKTNYDVNAAVPIPVGGDSVFVTSGYGHGCALVSVAGGSAKAVWENTEIQSHFNSGVLKDGCIYHTTDPGRLVCIDAKTGAMKWSQNGFEKGGLVGVDGTLIVLDGRSGKITMAEMSPNGYKELGSLPGLGGQSWSPPIVGNGKLIVRNKSTLACYDLK
jgi:outer membrane protein assembly factor BamB